MTFSGQPVTWKTHRQPELSQPVYLCVIQIRAAKPTVYALGAFRRYYGSFIVGNDLSCRNSCIDDGNVRNTDAEETMHK